MPDEGYPDRASEEADPKSDDKEAGYALRRRSSGYDRTGRLICPTGCSADWLSSPDCKNISVLARPKSPLYPRRLVPLEGRIAIVTDAG